VIATGRGLAGLAFADPGEEQTAFADMTRRWPNANYVETTTARRYWPARFRHKDVAAGSAAAGGPDRHRFRGAGVGDAVEDPMGRAVSYSDIACKIKSPKASRAVGAAIGKSGVVVVPCHRALGKDGKLTGYHWGITRKAGDACWEAGQGGRALMCLVGMG